MMPKAEYREHRYREKKYQVTYSSYGTLGVWGYACTEEGAQELKVLAWAEHGNALIRERPNFAADR